MIIEYKNKKPIIGKNVFIAPTAVIIGDVIIGDNVSIWYGAVLRGDENCIVVGEGTNIQENCTVHTDVPYPVIIGKFVTIGHNCIIHGCTIGDNTMIGMGSVILNGAKVSDNSMLGAGALLLQNKLIEPLTVAVGNPCKPMRSMTDADISNIKHSAEEYIRLISCYITDN